MPNRATLTLEESDDGDVFLKLVTQERLGLLEGPGIRVEPERYLKGACSIHVWRDPTNGILRITRWERSRLWAVRAP